MRLLTCTKIEARVLVLEYSTNIVLTFKAPLNSDPKHATRCVDKEPYHTEATRSYKSLSVPRNVFLNAQNLAIKEITEARKKVTEH